MPNLPARNTFSFKKGLTLIELIIVVAIIGIISVPLLLTYRSYRTNQALSASLEQVANHTRSVHIFAREARSQREWGIKNIDERVYAFYSSGATGVQEEQRYSLEHGVSFAQDFDILFEIGTGNTSSDYSISIVNTNGQQGLVDVSTVGIVEVAIE